MNFRPILSGAIGACLLVGSAYAQEPAPNFKRLLTPKIMSEIKEWANTDIVRISIEAQNKRWGKADQTKIDALDKQWRAEREANGDMPLIAATLSSPLSVYTTRIQGGSIGLFAEIFVMDQNGLNVGQSSITGDYWQGDEAKFQKSYNVSADAVFVDEPEWDDKAKIWRGQLSFTLTDASGKNPIGAITVEMNLTELKRRTALGA